MASANKAKGKKPAPKKPAKPAAARRPPPKAPAKKPAAPAKKAAPPPKPAPAPPKPAPKTAAKPAAKPAPEPPAPAKAAPAPPPAKAKAPPKEAPPPPEPPAKPSIASRPAGPVLTGPKVAVAPPPVALKPGMVDNQMFSAITYGLFAAINKTFGTFGQSVIKNASLRILEYGYKHGWLPPKSKDPLKALQEYFGRLEQMGYAEKITFSKKGDEIVCEMTNLADWDAIHELRELHYPLLPIFTAEMITAFVDQYFKLIVHVAGSQIVPEKRGLAVRFSIHEKVEPVLPSRVPPRHDEDLFE